MSGCRRQGFEDLLRREGRKTPTSPDLVFVAIDQASLDLTDTALPDEIKTNRAFQLMTQRPFPWSREVWGLFMDRVFQAGARLVIFDLVFDRPNDGDPQFRQALDRYRDKTVVGANFDLSQASGQLTNNIVPNASLIPPPQMEDDRVGFVVFFADRLDNKIRNACYTLDPNELNGLPSEGANPYVSLAGRALQKIGLGHHLPRDNRPHTIRFSEPNAYPPHPLWEILDDKLWASNYHDGRDLQGKILLVGPSAQVLHDYANTPMNPATPGPTLHLQALAAAMNNEFLRYEPPRIGLAGIGVAGLLAWILIAWVRRPALCLITLVIISAAYLAISRVLYDRVGLLILVVPTLVAIPF